MNKLNGMTLPTCEIFVNGQKRKLYGKNKNKVYLQNGDNFQLKFFNSLQERIGVQLCMNGIKVDNDLLVLNPGQEITIERYIGTNRKLTFSAYDIDTTNMSETRVKQSIKAIEKNGVLEIVFWNEKVKNVTNVTTDYTMVNPNWYIYPYDTNLYENTTSFSGFIGPMGSVGPFGTSGTSGTDDRKLSKKIETGRIEKGSVSNQYFSPIAFEIGEPFYRMKFKLLPFSLKPVKKKLYDSTTIKSIIDGSQTNFYIRTESTVREYCKCGYRISRGKGAWNFCPMCGKKIKK